MDAVAFFILGFGSCACLAGGLFLAESKRVHDWLTTPSSEVQVFDGPDGKVAIVKLDEIPMPSMLARLA